MGYIILVVLAVFGLYIGIWLLIAGLFWLILPAMVAILPVSGAVGALIGLIVPALTWAGVKSLRAATITPDDVVAGAAHLPSLGPAHPHGRDRAWPAYLVAQARADLRAAGGNVLDVLGHGWTTLNGLPSRAWRSWVWVPALVFSYPVWAAVSAGALAALGAVLAAAGLVLLAAWLVWLLSIGFARGVDAVIRRRRGASASCPHCHRVFDVPVFRCLGCGEPHRDLRPGRLGALARRCGCGALLPTTVLRAAQALPAHCPHCELPLRDGAAVHRDIRLPVFGPMSAGKTRLVYAGLVALRDRVGTLGGTVDFPDPTSAGAFDDGVRIISADAETPKTRADKPPVALTAQIRLPQEKAQLHVFDAAGELYGSREDSRDLYFLDTAQGLVFVLDPFSVPSVRDQLHGLDLAALQANPAQEEPEDVYQATIGRLRDDRVDTRRKSLAVAVVKADLLARSRLADPPEPDRLRDWLIGIGLDNLVLAAERDFGEVRYFLVASVRAERDIEPGSASRPFDWLLERAGLRLSAVQARRSKEGV